MNSRNIGIAVGIGGVVLLTALIISKKGAGSTNAVLYGVITDADTGQPIPNADVRVTDFAIPPSGSYSIDKSTKTNAEGRYSFDIDLNSIYVSPDWVGDGRGVMVGAIAFTYSGAGRDIIIFEGENECNLSLSH